MSGRSFRINVVPQGTNIAMLEWQLHRTRTVHTATCPSFLNRLDYFGLAF